MMKTISKLVLMVGCVILLSGCALTNETVPLNYHLGDAGGNILKGESPAKISIVVQDKRGVSNPRLIMHKRDGYNNQSSGGYLSKEPIHAVIKQALSSGLKQMGYKVSNNAQYTFDCQLLSVDDKYIVGLLETNMGLQMQLNVRVYSRKRHSIIWQNIIESHGAVNTEWPTTGVIRKAFNEALTNAIRQIQTSKTLVEAMSD